MSFIKKMDGSHKLLCSSTSKITNKQNVNNCVAAPKATDNTPKSNPSVDSRVLQQDKYKSLSQNLLSALECPVCCEYMTPPITLCENGHNICQICRPRLLSCPTCRCPLIDIRNVTLENIARDVNLPCPNSDYGCTFSNQLDGMANHLATCNFRPYNCIFFKYNNCKWKGQHNKIADHVVRYHERKLLKTGSLLNENCLQFELSKAECFNDGYLAILAFGEVFLYHRMFDIENKKLSMAVQYFGLQENTVKFQINLKMFKNNGNQKINISSKAHYEKDDVGHIFLTGECVNINFDMLMSYTKGKKYVVLKKNNT